MTKGNKSYIYADIQFGRILVLPPFQGRARHSVRAALRVDERRAEDCSPYRRRNQNVQRRSFVPSQRPDSYFSKRHRAVVPLQHDRSRFIHVAIQFPARRSIH